MLTDFIESFLNLLLIQCSSRTVQDVGIVAFSSGVVLGMCQGEH